MQLPVNSIPLPKLPICASSPRIYICSFSNSNCVSPPTWDLHYFLPWQTKMCTNNNKIVSHYLKNNIDFSRNSLENFQKKGKNGIKVSSILSRKYPIQRKGRTNLKYLVVGKLHLHGSWAINIVTNSNLSKLQLKKNR